MTTWHKVAEVTAFQRDGGGCVKIGNMQIAVFNFGRSEWYAVQNLCPHQNRQVLARGLMGDASGEPKVACPLHKNAFSLRTGKHLGGEDWQLQTFPVKEEDGWIYLSLQTEGTEPPTTSGTCAGHEAVHG